MNKLKIFLANVLWFNHARKTYRRWEKATNNVTGTQLAVFNRLLSQNTNTSFGQEHGFRYITSRSMYQHVVPVRTYEDMAPYIDRIAAGEQHVLTAEPVQRFGLTSGSTQATKYIPYTASLVEEFQQGINPWVYTLFRKYPSLLFGKAYWSITPVGDRISKTSGGIPVGFDDEGAYFDPLTQKVLNTIMAVPESVARINDMESFTYTTLHFLLENESITWISIWNPSFLVLFRKPLHTWFLQIIEEIGIRNPKRAQQLYNIYLQFLHKKFTETDESGRTLYECIWPNLRLISCWAHGNAAVLIPKLQSYFPNVTIQPKGLLATEAFVSFPLYGDVSALSLWSHFYEFEPVDKKDTSIKLAHELGRGKQYAVIVTTSGGLYRYRLNDIVEVVDFYNDCPLIRFISRQSKVVDVRGEKLNEEHVRRVVTSVLNEHDVKPKFWMMAPSSDFSYYVLYLQPFAGVNNHRLRIIVQEVDRDLHESYHYEYARRLGQLKGIKMFTINRDADPQRMYLERCVELGQRLGDIKPTFLHPDTQWQHQFPGSFV